MMKRMTDVERLQFEVNLRLASVSTSMASFIVKNPDFDNVESMQQELRQHLVDSARAIDAALKQFQENQ